MQSKNMLCCIVTWFSLAGIVYILCVVAPSHEKNFCDMGVDLPMITCLVLRLSEVMRRYWSVLIPILFALPTIYFVISTNKATILFVIAGLVNLILLLIIALMMFSLRMPYHLINEKLGGG